MANFVKWRGPFLNEGSPSISHTIQPVTAGAAYVFGIYGGKGLKVGPNNPALAQINERDAVESSNNNITWYELVGLQAGHVMIEARNPADGAVWDYFQLAVKPRGAKIRPPIKGVAYDYNADTAHIGPNWNASMVLTLKLGLLPANGIGGKVADFNGNVFATKPWTNQAWGSWTDKFRKLIESRWSEKFWLASPAALSELQVANKATGTHHRVNLHCVLRVKIVPVGQADHRIPVVQATQTLPPGPVVINSNTATFRSDSTQLDQQDLKTDSGLWATLTSRPFNTATHEIGHLLGLHHPFESSPAASVTGNTAYCVVGLPDCSTVMGLGDELRPSYASPWQNAAASWFNSAGNGHTLKPADFSPSIFRLAPVTL